MRNFKQRVLYEISDVEIQMLFGICVSVMFLWIFIPLKYIGRNMNCK